MTIPILADIYVRVRTEERLLVIGRNRSDPLLCGKLMQNCRLPREA
jgi:hypothetical protein